MAFLKVNDRGVIRFININLVVMVEKQTDQTYTLYMFGGTKLAITLLDETSINDLLGDVVSFLKEKGTEG